MDIARTIELLTVMAIPLVLAITLHEAAHAYAAKMFGDRTAYMLGRMTLNPVKHIDPFWTIGFPLLLLLLKSPLLFGAAKPVPVNFSALRNPKRDMIWVAAAGPIANLIMLIGWLLLEKILSASSGGEVLVYFIEVARAGVFLNAVIMIFNLLPILPLDGGRIVAGLLPDRLSYQWSRLETYGMPLLILVLFLDWNFRFIFGLVDVTLKALYSVFGF